MSLEGWEYRNNGEGSYAWDACIREDCGIGEGEVNGWRWMMREWDRRWVWWTWRWTRAWDGRSITTAGERKMG